VYDFKLRESLSSKSFATRQLQGIPIMQMSLGHLPRQHAHVTAIPRRSCCKLSVRAVAATERELAPQQVSKPAPHGRLYNFAAGPAVLPVEVLEEAQEGLLNWKGSGTSVMEMSHRGKEFSSIIHQAEQDLRSLLNIPDNYQVCYLSVLCLASAVPELCFCLCTCRVQSAACSVCV